MIFKKPKYQKEIEKVENTKIDEILTSLLDTLKDPSDWKIDDVSNNPQIEHKKYPITVNHRHLIRPCHIRFSRKWRRIIREHIERVYHNHFMSEFEFAHKVIKGVYPLCFTLSNYRSQEQEEILCWLEENSTTEQYFYRSVKGTRYHFLIDEELALAFKLKFE